MSESQWKVKFEVYRNLEEMREDIEDEINGKFDGFWQVTSMCETSGRYIVFYQQSSSWVHYEDTDYENLVITARSGSVKTWAYAYKAWLNAKPGDADAHEIYKAYRDAEKALEDAVNMQRDAETDIVKKVLMDAAICGAEGSE